MGQAEVAHAVTAEKGVRRRRGMEGAAAPWREATFSGLCGRVGSLKAASWEGG